MKLCVYCKGRHPDQACPMYAKALALMRSVPRLKSTSFVANPPAPFVGHHGYPNVNIGVLTPGHIVSDASKLDNPKQWARDNLGITELVAKRASLINSKQRNFVRETSNVTEISREVAMAKRPAELEISLKKLPSRARLSVDSYAAPTGPSAQLKKLRATSNIAVPRKLERVVDDKGLKATEAVSILNKKGFDETRIMRVLSVGLLGQKRKLVPTRWAITATDDMLAKKTVTRVRALPAVNEFELYMGDYLGNYYFVLLLPASWSYELFETSIRGYHKGRPLPSFAYDYEEFEGRKGYATNTAGGYYSVRLAVLEHLLQRKRQATAVVFRLITNEYTVPMGVWVTRESARRAMGSKPLRFASKELALSFLHQFVDKKFGFPLKSLSAHSRFLAKRTTQFRLSDFGKI